MAMRITPSHAHPTSTTPSKGAPSAPGVHDTLRSNLGLTASSAPKGSSTTAEPLQSSHPLEARLTSWRATQESLKMEGLRRTYGIAEPIKRQMELKTVTQGEWRPAALGGSAGVHGDILAGRDGEISWEDVYTGEGGVDSREGALGGFHEEMEGRLGMDW